MATALYFRNALQEVTSGVSANLDGLNISWVAFVISTTAGSGQVASSTATVAGATNGVEVQPSTNYAEWLTSPLAADVTISGSITWNLWASESSMSANVAINGILEVIDGATGTITLIDKTARTTELGTSLAAVNFSETPASGVACKKGDRLRARVFGDDAGTMASGFTFAFNYNGGLAADTGGSLLTLTEDLTFDEHGVGCFDSKRRPGGVDESRGWRPGRRHERRRRTLEDPDHRHRWRNSRRLVHEAARGDDPERPGSLQHPRATEWDDRELDGRLRDRGGRQRRDEPGRLGIRQ
jgi:hypothetical protein